MISTENFEYPKLLKYFEEISAIPRASYHEQMIAQYLCDFARARGLEYYHDEANNVLINLPASEGCEDRPALLLQGHTDMVCEKNEGVEHDFDTEGLELYEEDGWIRARGTTLGADNGVAVAVMLCVLDGEVGAHGPIQCLFTATEEVGLDGVRALDYSKIYARRMINMDSADESLIITGCAGGVRSNVCFDPKPRKVKAEYLATVKISGLYGGHSGEDIDKGRANANKLMGRVLDSLCTDGACLVSIKGGSKENAIPRECVATVAINEKEAVEKKIDALRAALSDGLCADDKDFALTVEFEPTAKAICVDQKTQDAVVFLMHTAANGIFAMNVGVADIVEWSRNLGVVCVNTGEAIVVFNSRSSFPSRIDASIAELDNAARILGARTEHYNRYPGWTFAPVSAVRDSYARAYKELFGKVPEMTVIHAGLECGYISEALPDMDIISCGPIVKDLHSPDEKLDKASFGRFFKVIKRVIEN
jgi:dipeptidase D